MQRASVAGDHDAWLAASEAAQAFQRDARAKHARWEQASADERSAAAFHEYRGRLDRKNEAARMGRTQGRDYRPVERANVAASIARVAYDDAAQAWTFGDTAALLRKTAAWEAWQAARAAAAHGTGHVPGTTGQTATKQSK